MIEVTTLIEYDSRNFSFENVKKKKFCQFQRIWEFRGTIDMRSILVRQSNWKRKHLNNFCHFFFKFPSFLFRSFFPIIPHYNTSKKIYPKTFSIKVFFRYENLLFRFLCGKYFAKKKRDKTNESNLTYLIYNQSLRIHLASYMHHMCVFQQYIERRTLYIAF